MTHLLEYRDHTISLTDNHRFSVAGPEFDEKHLSFDSMREAKERIDARLRAAERQAAATRTVAHVLLNARAEIVTVRGINRTDGTLLGADTGVYPNFPRIRHALIKRDQLAAELKKTERFLEIYHIRNNQGHGRIRPEDYERKLSDLENQIKNNTAKAARDLADDEQAA